MPITNPLAHKYIGNSNLTAYNNKEIIAQLYDDGISLRDIADTLGISHMTVYRTIKRC